MSEVAELLSSLSTHTPLALVLGQQNSQDAAAGAVGCIILVIALMIMLIVVVGMWKTFEKAGQPGWAAIIPIYNVIVMLQIAGMPLWWIILFFIPYVNLIPAIIMAHKISKNFGHGLGMTLALIFVPFIGYPILGFGDSQYNPVE